MKTENDIFLVSGKSDYKIIISDGADFYENYAAEELKRLFFDATGVELQIYKESELKLTAFDQNLAVFSVGETAICKTSGVDRDYAKLKRDGYRVVTKGKTVILVGGGSYGTVYAVYGFMEKQFGYRYYHPDEVKINKTKDAELLSLDITDIPSFENRTGGFYYSGSDFANPYEGIPDCAIRMRTFNFWGTLRDGENFFGSWGHNHGLYLDGRKYYKEHPDWYSPEYTQLCLSNEEMWVEFTKNVIKRVARLKNKEYFLIGQEDCDTFCGCDRCKKLIKKIGMSGVMMRFINHVAREVEKWRLENCPERTIYIGTFAYHKTAKPPVKKDRKGNYKPLHPCVVPEKNVFIMVAPIKSDNSATITDPVYNAPSKESLEGWASLCNNLHLWIYCSNFSRSFTFFDNWRVLADNYKIFKKFNFSWLYYENNYNKQGIAFQSMLQFIHAQLAWNVNLDLKDLIVEFMDNFYKEASPYMKEYLKRLDKYYQDQKAVYGKKLGRHIATRLWNAEEMEDVLHEDFYSYEFLSDMMKLLSDAIDAIKNAKYDADKEKELIDRIRLERLTIKYLIGHFCEKDLGRENYEKFLDEFEKDCDELGITGAIEFHMNAKETVESWKKGVKTLEIPEY